MLPNEVMLRTVKVEYLSIGDTGKNRHRQHEKPRNDGKTFGRLGRPIKVKFDLPQTLVFISLLPGDLNRARLGLRGVEEIDA